MNLITYLYFGLISIAVCQNTNDFTELNDLESLAQEIAEGALTNDQLTTTGPESTTTAEFDTSNQQTTYKSTDASILKKTFELSSSDIRLVSVIGKLFV